MEMDIMFYSVEIEGWRDMNSDQRKAARRKIEEHEGENYTAPRFKDKRQATQKAHWIQSTTGVKMKVQEVYPVTMRVL